MPQPTRLTIQENASIDGQGAKGPLSVLENSDYSFDVLKYPDDVGSANVPHFVQFNINLPISSQYIMITNKATGNISAMDNYDTLAKAGKRYVPTNGSPVGEAASTGGILGGIKLVTTIDPASAVVATAKGTVGAAAAEGLTVRPQLQRIKSSIAIYLPDTMVSQYDHDYNTVSLTAALGEVGVVNSVVKGMNMTLDKAKAIGTDFEAGRGINYQNAPIAEAAGMIGEKTGMLGEGFKDLTVKSSGRAINPQAELIFRATQNREYTYEFNFQPRSQGEAKSAFDIINTFKLYAAPEVANEGNGRYFIPPGQFDIRFMFKNQENKWIAKVSTCVLKFIAVNYAGSGSFVSFSDGFPVHINLILRFQEVDIITRELISKFGY